MATYDLKYPGAAIDAILDTAYDLQNAGYIFRGLASEYSNTPTKRSWVLAGEGETGHGFTSPIPKGYIGVCVFNGTSWTGKLVKCVSIDSAPTPGSTNVVSSGGAYAALNQLATGVAEALDNMQFTDVTPPADEYTQLKLKLATTDSGIERIITYLTFLSATTSKAGLLSAADKAKLDAILGNLRSLEIEDTTAYADLGTKIVESIKATIGGTEETISTFQLLAATASKAGLLSAADKAKLDALWSSGYQFAGIATPSTTPLSTTSKIFYIAIGGGTYTNFGDLNVTQGINIIYKSGEAWSVAQVVGVDNEPTANSDNFVKSGGVLRALALGAVYDVSAKNPTAGPNNDGKFESLSALLSDDNLNTLIPTAVRKGGMSIKFVQSSDNKYVQYRLTSPTWSTDIHDWTSEDPYFIDKIMQEVNEALDENTPIEIHGDVTNAPDEEDLTSVNVGGTDVLKFKDKAYNPLTYSGMGRVYLRKNIVNGVNTLTQEMMSDANTIYIIQYDFTLGEDITVPANCVLEFDGGSISGTHTITGNNTGIEAGLVKIFDIDVALEGNWRVAEIYPEWFGAKGDYRKESLSGTDDSSAFTKAIAVAQEIKCNTVKLSSSAYFINKGINISDGNIRLVGCYANLREDYKFTSFDNNVKEITGSMFVSSSTCAAIIKFDETVTHPVQIEHIAFRNYWENGNLTAKAIYFDSNFWGPTWPFIVEYCHFFGFDKAISISARREYIIEELRIKNNGFHRNGCCVHFADIPDDYSGTTYGFSRGHVSDLIIEDNAAHQNEALLYGGVRIGSAIIQRNNIEDQYPCKFYDNVNNPTTTSDYSFIVNMQIGGGASLTFIDNYSEYSYLSGPSKPYLHIDVVDFTSSNYDNIRNRLLFRNNSNGKNTPYYIEISGPNTDECKAGLIIEDCDNIIVYNGGILDMILYSKIPDIRIYNGQLHIESSKCPLNTRNIRNDYTEYTSKRIRFDFREYSSNPIQLSYIGGNLYHSRPNNEMYFAASFNLVQNSNKIAIASVCKINKLIDAKSYYLRNTNDAPGGLTYDIASFTDLPWQVDIRVLDNYAGKTYYQSLYNYITYSNKVACIMNYSFIIDNTKNRVDFPKSFDLGVKYNEVNSSELAIISNPKEGDTVYIYDIKKNAVYDGSEWVDATGNTV